MTDKEKYLYLLATIRAALRTRDDQRYHILSDAISVVEKGEVK